MEPTWLKGSNQIVHTPEFYRDEWTTKIAEFYEKASTTIHPSVELLLNRMLSPILRNLRLEIETLKKSNTRQEPTTPCRPFLGIDLEVPHEDEYTRAFTNFVWHFQDMVLLFRPDCGMLERFTGMQHGKLDPNTIQHIIFGEGLLLPIRIVLRDMRKYLYELKSTQKAISVRETTSQIIYEQGQSHTPEPLAQEPLTLEDLV